MPSGRPGPCATAHATCLFPVLAALCVGLNLAGGACAQPAAEIPGPHLQWSEPRLEAGFGWLSPADDDVDGIYGSLPLAQLRYSARAGLRTRLFIGAGYGRRHGDPYYDQPTFAGPDAALLEVVAFQTGVRVNALPPGPFGLWLGSLLELTDVSETLPRERYDAGEGPTTANGLTVGVGLTLGPQWTPERGRWGLGGEFAVVGNSGDLGRSPALRGNLTGWRGSLYLTWRL
jgi:hypothetical protein